MGIFNLFKGGKSDKVNANKNSTFLTFDDVTIDTLVKNSVKIEEEMFGSTKKLIHHSKLDSPLYGLFNTIELTLGEKDGQLLKTQEGETKIVDIMARTNNLKVDNIKTLTNQTMKLIHKNDDPWSEMDKNRINQGTWRGRMSMEENNSVKVHIHLHDGELSLYILNFNDFKNGKITKNSTEEIASNSKEQSSFNQKFERNLTMFIDYDLVIDGYCDITESWDELAFENQDLTHRENHNMIKQILEVEYSDALCEKVENGLLEHDEKVKLESQLDEHYQRYFLEYREISEREQNMLDSLSN